MPSSWHCADGKTQVEENKLTAAAGEKESVLLSRCMEVNTLEVEEELATLAWTEGFGMGRWA